MCKSIHFSIYIRKPLCFFPLLAKSGAVRLPQYRLFSFEFFEKAYCVIQRKICNGKYKGLAIQYIFHDCFENSREICIQYIFHDCLNLHREMHMFFFHYWRSQEPPVFRRCGRSRCSFFEISYCF